MEKNLILAIGIGLLSFFTSIGLAQENENSWPLGDSSGKFHLSPQVMMGQIIPHRHEMQHLIQGQSTGISLQFLRRKNFSWWGMYQKQPITGVELYYTATGNRKQLGDEFALSYFMYRPYGKSKRPIWYGMGLGMAYATKTWNLNDNYQAPVISAHLNACLTLHAHYPIIQTKKSDWLIGLRMTHISNGSFQLPNLGTNNFQMTLQYLPRMIRKRESIHIIDILPSFQRNRFCSITIAGGFKETFQPLGKKYPVGNFQFNFAKRINDRHRISIGADYLYQPALKKLWEKYKGVMATPSQCMQAGIAAGYQSIFGLTTFSIQQGFYIYSPWMENGRFYHRLSIRRNFGLNYSGKRGFVYAGLFTHWAKADHIELGCGFDL